MLFIVYMVVQIIRTIPQAMYYCTIGLVNSIKIALNPRIATAGSGGSKFATQMAF
jgi:hypothetical protein